MSPPPLRRRARWHCSARGPERRRRRRPEDDVRQRRGDGRVASVPARAKAGRREGDGDVTRDDPRGARRTTSTPCYPPRWTSLERTQRMHPASLPFTARTRPGDPVHMERTGKWRSGRPRLASRNPAEERSRDCSSGGDGAPVPGLCYPAPASAKTPPVTQMCNAIGTSASCRFGTTTVSHGGVPASAEKHHARGRPTTTAAPLGTTLAPATRPGASPPPGAWCGWALDAKTQAKFKVLGKGDAQLGALRGGAAGGSRKSPRSWGASALVLAAVSSLDPASEPTERVLTDAQVRYAEGVGIPRAKPRRTPPGMSRRV